MLKKVVNSVKKDGIYKTIKKGGRFIKYRLLVRKKRNVINKVVDVKQFSTIIVFENNFGWNKIMKQRPQQIAENLPEDTLMFYHSHEDVDYDKKDRIKRLRDNLIILDLGYFRDDLLAELSIHDNKYLMVYSTDYIPYDRIQMYKEYNYDIVYEYVDDINAELSGQDLYKLLSKTYNKLSTDDRVYTVCTANLLLEKAKTKGFKNTTLINNGVDYNHFEYKDYPIPSDIIKIKKNHKNLICYYGALASWFDYDLIKKIAEDKNIGIVLIGQDYDKTLEKSHILDVDNIYYLGKRPYSELPAYGCNMDVLIIPFRINEITKATSPVKIFEYMAMEKQIVTTALPECKKYKSILYSQNHEEFIKNIYKAIKNANDDKKKMLLKKEALENTWQSKAKNMVEFINHCKYARLQGSLEEILNKSSYDRIVIWRSPFGWNVPLFQRPQHIAMQFAKKKCLVFYEVTKNTDCVESIQYVDDNLYIVNFENYVMKDILYNSLKPIKKPKYLQIYSTNWSMGIDELEEYIANGFKVLYEYIDDISPELAGADEIPEYIMQKYEYAIKHKEVLIVTTATQLYEDIIKKRGKDNLTYACNGVNYDFFQKVEKNYKFEHEFKKIINNGKINICYYGALASWFDYDLIRKINETGKYNIILFGIKYDSSYDDSGINRLKNVHFLGSREYKILKNYASKMDILTIPFVINSITQATSPLKLFEYMALHKPIVTTAMNECKKYKSVLIGNSQDEFLSCLEKAYQLRNDKSYIELLDDEARQNDWSAKADSIIDLMKENERRKK